MSPILLTSTRNPSSRGENRQNTVSCFCDTALFGSVVQTALSDFSLFVKSHLILVISDLTRFIKFWLVSTLALSLCMCPRISRWFLLVLFLVPLSSPWWGQPGHIVRLVPYLPLLFALYTFPSLFSFLSLGFSLSLRAWLVSFVGFSLCFISTFSLLGPAWAYCPARPSSFPSSYYLFHFLLYFSLLSALLPLFLSTGVCPKRLRPMWQHLKTQSGL